MGMAAISISMRKPFSIGRERNPGEAVGGLQWEFLKAVKVYQLG
jgi:hypothetical protein